MDFQPLDDGICILIVMNTKKTFDYRKYYKDYYGISFPETMHIHHIDGNRSNNNIENLVLLPSKVHQDYHLIESDFKMCFYNSNPTFFYFATCQNIVCTISKIEMNNLMTELNCWYDLKIQYDNELLRDNPCPFYQGEINKYINRR